jgi:hypothetical protein
MTIDWVPPSERSLVRFATPYLEVETRSISSLERTITRELAQAKLAVRRTRRREGDHPNRRGVRLGRGSPKGVRSSSFSESRS